MARKRMLDPGIWTDGDVIQLTNDELVVFVGCISLSDDEGIFEADPHAMYFALARREHTPETIRQALDKIETLGMIVRYDKFAFLPNFYKHQTLNRPSYTKRRRPPLEVVRRHPDYIAGWEETFSHYEGRGEERRFVEVSYPGVSAHGTLSEGSDTDPGAVTPNRKEINRKEINGREGKGREREGKGPEEPALIKLFRENVGKAESG